MRIVVKNKGEKDIRLFFSTGLLFNPVTALFVPAVSNKYGVHVTVRQAMAVIKALHNCKHRLPDWVMVEAENADGGKVEIRM